MFRLISGLAAAGISVLEHPNSLVVADSSKIATYSTQRAATPRSRLRIRIASATFDRKILPSPILPVAAL
jgi:hypothetical protein